MKGLLNTIFYLFRKDRKFYFKLVKMLGFLPGNLSYYRTAFIHKSASIQNKNGDLINNERLEFLGDAILGSIVAEYLYINFPNRDEGFMTKLRSRIVKRKNLNLLAEKMGIPGMMQTITFPDNMAKHLHGNAFEALIGAIYLDKGYRSAAKFFSRRIIQKHIDLLQLAKKDSDYKSQIIEWAQKYKKEVVFETNEENAASNLLPAFIAFVKQDDNVLGTGKGGSKKEAEQSAAKEALSSLQNS